MRQPHAAAIVAARPFTSVAQFHQATGLPADAVRRVAEADAFSSVARTRRPAAWDALGLPDGPTMGVIDNDPRQPLLPLMPLGQEVMVDYATAGLSLKCHPVSLVRPILTGMGAITAAELRQRQRGWVSVAGLVLVRQRPGTASGIVFMTLEDETGTVNLIVRPAVYDRFKPAARHAVLLGAEGRVERQGAVVHLLGFKLRDLGELLAGYQVRSRDFH